MKLIKINQAKLIEISTQWDHELSEFDTVHPARCLGVVSRARYIIDDENNTDNQYVYAVDDGGSYECIVILSHAVPKSPKAWLKMLELTLSPRYAADQPLSSVDRLIDIGACVLADLYDLSSDEHKSDTIKIYGDSLMDARIWRSIAKNIDTATVPFEISSHGQWLVLSDCNNGNRG